MTEKQTHVTIRVSQREKEKLDREAKKMGMNKSKFVREYFIKLISNEDNKI